MDTLLAALRAHLDRDGLPGGLRFLNDRVPHRFTGVYRLDHGTMHAAGLFDKRGEVPPQALQAVPLADSFCQFVLREGHFLTSGSAQDERLAGHPYQGVVATYVGLPLTHRGDDLSGTLCHFDFEQVQLPPAEFDFLRKAALLLPRYLPRQ